jgi:EAL domain-containing protein (putative c-di-GMP-specific phosphodiesterase class I)
MSSRNLEIDAATWVPRIREALDNDGLVLYSQPIVPLDGGEPGEEVLLRLVDQSGEAIPARTFLRFAEPNGMIGEIDRWVVPEAIRLAARGRRIHANVSATSISSLDLVAVIEQELRRAPADPGNLVIEVTEAALMADLEAGEAFAQRLSEIGCGLALDDFGTGFGSFTYLTRLPFDYLKIDIDFVHDIASNLATQHLVKATVGLARDFGYETIAEGVEDAETLAVLEDHGVGYAQGFHLGRPAPLG